MKIITNALTRMFLVVFIIYSCAVLSHPHAVEPVFWEGFLWCSIGALAISVLAGGLDTIKRTLVVAAIVAAGISIGNGLAPRQQNLAFWITMVGAIYASMSENIAVWIRQMQVLSFILYIQIMGYGAFSENIFGRVAGGLLVLVIPLVAAMLVMGSDSRGLLPREERLRRNSPLVFACEVLVGLAIAVRMGAGDPLDIFLGLMSLIAIVRFHFFYCGLRDELCSHDRAIAADPDDAAAYHKRGAAKLALYDFRGALEDHSRAIMLDRRTYLPRILSSTRRQEFQHHYDLASHYAKEGWADESLSELELASEEGAAAELADRLRRAKEFDLIRRDPRFEKIMAPKRPQ